MDPDAVVPALRGCLDSGRDTDISVYLAAATNAVATAFSNGDEAALTHALDRLTDVAAVIFTFAPKSASAQRAVSALHDVFDGGQANLGRVNALSPEQLWLRLLAHARALGALAIRLRHWQPLRDLILHDVSGQPSTPWRYWVRYGDVSISRARLYSAGSNVLDGSRMPIRLAAEQALQFSTLRPDGVTDEDSLLTSICEFDLVTNLVSVWESRDARPGEAAFPYFAAWGGERSDSWPSASSSTGRAAKRCCPASPMLTLPA